MTDILFVFGTRPEAIKIGPVYAELKEMGVKVAALCTGQHTDLLRGTPAESDLADAGNCGLASSGCVTEWLTQAHMELDTHLSLYNPQLVVVQGDTMSAYAGASQARSMKIPVAHIEAGVRSHNPMNPWPEEKTRVDIAQLADWHYAPTDQAFANLVAEGVRPERIRVTGNTIVSALDRYTDAQFVKTPEKQILVTLHRREIQTPQKAEELARGVYAAAFAAHEHTFLWPQHPAFTKLCGDVGPAPKNVQRCGPMPYRDFVQVMCRSKGILTDSGGLVEEAATMGVPTVILRDANDRPEAVDAGIAVQQSPTYDGVLQGTLTLVIQDIPRQPTSVYGFTDAALRVAQHLAAAV